MRGAPLDPSAIATGLSRSAVTVDPLGMPPTPTAPADKSVHVVILAYLLRAL
jgi:hypothetical protein